METVVYLQVHVGQRHVNVNQYFFVQELHHEQSSESCVTMQ